MPHVAIVGGGASGVLAAAALAASPTVSGITVIERAERAGPGLAYGAAAPHHLLNSPAGRMGAAPGDDAHFVAWCAAAGDPVDPAAFVPRRRYGDYLAAVLDGLVSSGRVRIVHGEAVGVEPGPTVRLADARSIAADRVVLALGNPPPAGAGLDPWGPVGVPEQGAVLLLGTGLTMVDVATRLARDRPGLRLTATSRSLLLPRVHLLGPQPPGPGIRPTGPGLSAIVAAFRDRMRIARAEGRAWQTEVDGVRPQVNTLWSAMPPADRSAFVRHVARRWEVHRHRMAPAVAAEIAGLRESGRLHLAPGADRLAVDVVVDCTGPRPAATPGWNPLVDDLLAQGMLRPDPLGLGIAVDAAGAALDRRGAASPVLTVIGPARRGSEWECTAVPEIRGQAEAFADSLA